MPTLCKYNHTKIYIFFGYATLVAKKKRKGCAKKKRKVLLRPLFCLLIPFYLLCSYKNGLNYLTIN